MADSSPLPRSSRVSGADGASWRLAMLLASLGLASCATVAPAPFASPSAGASVGQVVGDGSGDGPSDRSSAVDPDDGLQGALHDALHDDIDGDLRSDLAKRLGVDAAATLDVPFALDAATRARVAEVLRPTGSDASRAARIVDYIFSDLDLRYATAPTRDAEAVFATREGNCLSFVNLFVALGRQLELAPFFVEVEDYHRWDHQRGMVVSRGHVVGGLYVAGALRTFDFLPYRPKGYRQLEPIDDVTAIAHFYNNLGAEALLDGDLELAADRLETAVDLAPRLVEALNNLAVLRARTGTLDDAVALYRRALEVEADHMPVLENLERALVRLGRDDEAAAARTRIETARRASPFYFAAQADRALADGAPGQALESLRQALARDSELPQVHVGLAKTYLALGELEKARHHLERALALDPSDPEARRLAPALVDEPTS